MLLSLGVVCFSQLFLPFSLNQAWGIPNTKDSYLWCLLAAWHADSTPLLPSSNNTTCLSRASHGLCHPVILCVILIFAPKIYLFLSMLVIGNCKTFIFLVKHFEFLYNKNDQIHNFPRSFSFHVKVHSFNTLSLQTIWLSNFVLSRFLHFLTFNFQLPPRQFIIFHISILVLFYY